MLLQTSKHFIIKGARLRIFVFNFQGTLYTGLADGRIVKLEGDKVIDVVQTGKPPCGKLVFTALRCSLKSKHCQIWVL